MVVDQEAFEKMKDEYYQLRRRAVATGLQTTAKLEKLGLKDMVQDLEGWGWWLCHAGDEPQPSFGPCLESGLDPQHVMVHHLMTSVAQCSVVPCIQGEVDLL